MPSIASAPTNPATKSVLKLAISSWLVFKSTAMLLLVLSPNSPIANVALMKSSVLLDAVPILFAVTVTLLLRCSSTPLKPSLRYPLLFFLASQLIPLISDISIIPMLHFHTLLRNPSIFKCTTTCGSRLLCLLTTRLYSNFEMSTTPTLLLPLLLHLPFLLFPCLLMLLSLFVLLMTLLLQLPLLPGPLFLQPSLLRLIASSLCPTGPPAPFALAGILSKLTCRNLFPLLLPALLMASTTATFSGATPTMRHFLTLLAAGGFFGIVSLPLPPTTSNLATVFYSTPTLLLTQPPTSPGRTCFHFLTLPSAFLDPSPSLNHLPTLLDVHPPFANSFHFHSGLL